MIRYVLSIGALVCYGLAFVYLYPRVGATVGALSFLPVVVTGWLFGVRGGSAGAVGVSILNAFLFPSAGTPLGWAVPAVATVFMGAFVGYTSDLRKGLRQRQEALAALATHDHLTGLLNRAGLEKELESVLERPGFHAVMYMDLDGFKEVNDTFGHAAGDRLLEQVAGRLGSNMRGGELVARLGGDEFVVAAPDLASRDEAVVLAQRLLERMRESMRTGGTPMPVTLSIGIALAPEDGGTADELLHAADQAMYKKKRNGKNGYCFPSLTRGDEDESPVTPFALRRAIDENEFTLVYQPLVHLPSRTLAGFEALVRWEHPRLGLLAPAAFLAMAEETGLIIPLGEWVVREACRQAAMWQEYDESNLSVSVNVSAAQIAQPNFLEIVQDALSESGLPPQRLELEITETLLIENFARVSETVNGLARSGVRIAIDDFGAGYSSLKYLHRLDCHTLKIDRSLLLGVLEDADAGVPERSGLIVRSIVRLAHELDMTVVGEGVETAAQGAFLRDAGSDFAQGYFFAKPIRPGDIRAWATGFGIASRVGAPRAG